VFDPHRFLPSAPPVERYAYLPFGAGPRGCMGGQFALTEATLVIANLLRSFEIELEDQEPVIPNGIIITRPNRAPGFLMRRRS
jgi:unspecific monooxygenase